MAIKNLIANCQLRITGMNHIPVLLKEAIALLAPKTGEFFIDGTFGDGGHARAILEKIGSHGKLLAVDWDEKAIVNCKLQIAEFGNLICAQSNYADLSKILKSKKLDKADGLLLDLGFSSKQIENSGRGFSFRKDEPLIMTYNNSSESLQELLNRISTLELEGIIREFGEERYAGRIAEAIIKQKRGIKTSKELAEIIANVVPKSYEHSRIHPATRTFQALRIYLNKELENLTQILNHLEDILNPGGRIAIISFHSLEDRIVKMSFKDLAKKGRISILTKKPVIASEEELLGNPRSRSAKLRAAIINKF